jgi:hypothetical protein
MATNTATTVDAYLESLPDDRRQVVAAVRDTVLRNLPEGYQETMQSGMINYVVPLERYPNTYNKQPLPYLSIAAQKSHYALYLICAYQNPQQAEWLRGQFAQAGKKFDMGKSCLRFRKLEDLPLDAIGELVASTPPAEFIAGYEAARQR